MMGTGLALRSATDFMLWPWTTCPTLPGLAFQCKVINSSLFWEVRADCIHTCGVLWLYSGKDLNGWVGRSVLEGNSTQSNLNLSGYQYLKKHHNTSLNVMMPLKQLSKWCWDKEVRSKFRCSRTALPHTQCDRRRWQPSYSLKAVSLWGQLLRNGVAASDRTAWAC